MKVRIEADVRGVVIMPLTRLGETLFKKYQVACRGADYDPRRRVNVASLEVLPAIVRRLQSERFEIEVSPDVAEQCEGAFAGLAAWAEDALQRVADHSDHLYEFQRIGAVKLASRFRFMLADEMGLGKTRQVIFAIPDRSPVLIVCPAIAKGVWRKEFERLRPEFRVRTLSGRGSFRWPEDGEVIIVNYDILPAPVLGPCAMPACTETRRFRKLTCKKHVDRTPFDNPDLCVQCGGNRHEGLDCLEVSMGIPAPAGLVLAADEAHGLKSRKSKRTQAFHALSMVARLRRGYVWLLTGTPLLNRPGELWELLLCADLAREAFGDFKTFAELFRGKKNYFGGFDFPKTVEGSTLQLPEWALSSLGEVMLRRTRKEVMPHLPTKSYDDIDVDLTSTLKRDCDKFVEQARVDISDPQFLDKVPFKETSRLRAALATAKIPAMEEFVAQYEEQDEPLIVFSAHRRPIDWFDGRDGWAVITGDVKSTCSASQPTVDEWTMCSCRFCIAELFRNNQLFGVAGTIDAMGVGIRFERAAHALFVDLDWTPQINAQGEDRLMGVTQTRPVMIHRLVGDHRLERRVAELCTIKDNLFASVIGAVKSNALPVLDVPSLKGMVVEGKKIRAAPTLAGVKRRPPKNAIEVWAAAGLKKLAGLDEDRARKRNAAGFSRFDTDIGQQLAAQIDMGLSDVQWEASVKLCKLYWRQIGEPPS